MEIRKSFTEWISSGPFTDCRLCGSKNFDVNSDRVCEPCVINRYNEVMEAEKKIKEEKSKRKNELDELERKKRKDDDSMNALMAAIV